MAVPKKRITQNRASKSQRVYIKPSNPQKKEVVRWHIAAGKIVKIEEPVVKATGNIYRPIRNKETKTIPKNRNYNTFGYVTAGSIQRTPGPVTDNKKGKGEKTK